MSKVEVLFFGADPLAMGGSRPALQLAAEARQIELEVQAARHGDGINFDTCWATRIQDLRQSLLQVKPHVVHFSGHGGDGGLVLVSSDGKRPHRVDTGALKQFFKAYSGQIRLVILNACVSQPQAQAIADVVGCAIGTPTDILDQAAIDFSAAFYGSIASGESVKDALEQARATLRMEGFAESELPVLLKGAGVDPSKLVLVSPKSPRPRKHFSGIAGILAAAAVAIAIWLWPEPSAACATARAVLDTARMSLVAASPQGLVDAASASGVSAGPASEQLDDAKDLHAAGNYTAAFPLFKQAALAGDYEAMSYVGVAYLRGEGIAPNPDSASAWLDTAKDSRDPRGMNGVGEAFERGFGPEPSNRWAVYWYELAAEKGFPDAMRNLARMYRDGLYLDADRQRALELYGKAAKAGLVDAMVDAGAIYERGVPTDLGAARCWYDGAAEAGSTRGMVESGRVHEARGDYREARHRYEQAADRNDADALNNLGRLYQNGWGVSVDLVKARQLYQRAADLGSEVGRGNLARLNAG